MNTHILTIQDLNRKTVPELHAIFRDAASVSANTHRSNAERAAAQKTLDNIQRSLAARHSRP